jgi:hypothetical protein
MEGSSSKNLKGLFNLVRKEFKDLRQDVQHLEEIIAALTARGNEDENAEKDEIFKCLRRIESLLRDRGGSDVGRSATERLGEKEARLLRSLLLQDAEKKDSILDADSNVENISSSGRNSPTPESSEAGTSKGQRTDGQAESRISSAVVPASRAIQLGDQVQKAQTEPVQCSVETSQARDAQVEERLDTMSSQIGSLMESQREILATLRSLSDRKGEGMNNPVVVPPPRKVGRKVVGFVYEDEGDEES